MKQSFAIGAVLVAVLAVWAAIAALYTVSEVQQAIVVRLGKPIAVETEPGLKVKLPFADDVIFYDARLLTVELPLEETILGDQKRIQEQVYAGFRITDPLQFYLSVRTMAQAQIQLIQLIGSSVRRELGQVPLGALLSHDRDRVSDDIRADVAEKTKSLGIEISEIRFHRADLLVETSQAIYDRMKSERLREAKELRAQGSEWAQEIQAKADRERTVLLSQAQRQASITRGEADAEANNLLAAAYSQDPAFYEFYRSLQSYQRTLADANPMLVLSPDARFLSTFETGPPAPKK
jgi:modulator of FtsH protease HflC